MSSMEAVIVLNAGYEFIGLISWQRAMVLLFNGKVEVVKHSDRIVRTVKETFRVPAIVRLYKFIRQIYKREVPFSRKNILVRDSYTCQYCGREFPPCDLTIDHIVPKVQGGDNNWSNVVTSCKACNIRKGGMTPRQAGMRLIRQPFKPTIMEFINLYLKKRFGVDLTELLQF
jgi:5-methylcytosine-specific restriction endonuclease McrA|uniref:HNH endonuclease n=1 Tax=Desulfomonile tiedjei TaxID=2358 RepID=A0A7C4ARD1_9BACT